MQTVNLNIAKLALQIQSEWPIAVDDNFQPFWNQETTPPQETVHLTMLPTLPPVPAPQSWMYGVGNTRLADGRTCVLHRLSDVSAPYLMELYHTADDRLFCYSQQSNEKPVSVLKVFNDIKLEELLLRHETMILHSALIRWQDATILFSAPSGTGKSTQADLWAKYKGADILNGDRSALRKLEGRWAAFGLPFAGSSDIFRNEGAPVRTIVMLEQAPQNTITRLSPAQAMRRIWPEFTVHRWDPAFTNRSLDLVLDLLASVPVYLLSCRPDEGAVQLLHDTITQEV